MDRRGVLLVACRSCLLQTNSLQRHLCKTTSFPGNFSEKFCLSYTDPPRGGLLQAAGSGAELTINDALGYIRDVETTFAHNREVYETFMKIMAEYKAQRCVHNMLVNLAGLRFVPCAASVSARSTSNNFRGPLVQTLQRVVNCGSAFLYFQPFGV